MFDPTLQGQDCHQLCRALNFQEVLSTQNEKKIVAA
jgi:hypothetical protein